MSDGEEWRRPMFILRIITALGAALDTHINEPHEILSPSVFQSVSRALRPSQPKNNMKISCCVSKDGAFPVLRSELTLPLFISLYRDTYHIILCACHSVPFAVTT